MKILITALLSAALLLLTGNSGINNSTLVQAKATHVQAVAPEKATEVKSDAPTEQKTEVEPEPQQPQIVVAAKPLTDKESLMQQAGIPRTDWAAVDYIVSHESSWRPTAWNTTGSGAYGLCQALPASKMASAGDDYMSNPVTQLRWCHDYAESRYSGWWSAFAFWKANRWW